MSAYNYEIIPDPYCYAGTSVLINKLNIRDGLGDFCFRLAYYAAELNTLHPFRDGNGRATRTFLQQLAVQAGYRIHWQLTYRKELLSADIAAFNVRLEPLINIYLRIVKSTRT